MKPYLFPMLAFTAMLLFTSTATAEIKTLCNTGETAKTISGCTGVLVTPNPTGGGVNRDGNWGIAYPYPSTLSPTLGPCGLGFIRAWVDTPYSIYPDGFQTVPVLCRSGLHPTMEKATKPKAGTFISLGFTSR